MSDDQPYGPQGIGILLVLIAAIGCGATPVFTKWLIATGAPFEVISFYRFVITAALMLPFLSLKPETFSAIAMALLAGAAMGLGWTGYAMLLTKTTIVTAGIVYFAYPFFTLIFALIMIGWTPSVRGSMAALLVIGAVIVALQPVFLITLSWQSTLVALAAPLSFGFAAVVTAGWLQSLNPLQRLGSVTLGACIGVLPLVLLRHPPEILIPAGDQIALIIGLGAGAALIPSFIYVVAAPRIGALKAAIAGSIELPTMAFFGWWVFQETPIDHEYAAGALVIVAIILVAMSRLPKGRPPAA
ncbi:MAG: DMT family transporter [Pseudomonadota bacterium]